MKSMAALITREQDAIPILVVYHVFPILRAPGSSSSVALQDAVGQDKVRKLEV